MGWPTVAAALDDFGAGIARPWLWYNLAWLDIRQKFTRSLVGPLWLTVNIALFTGAIYFLFGASLGGGDPAYLAYVGLGFVLWSFINQVMNESGLVFVAAGEAIRNAVLPLSTQVLRLVCRNAIVLLHNVVVTMAILALLGKAAVPAWTVLPALALVLLAALACATLIGVIAARFRDVTQFVTNGMQLMFFLTPILWKPGPGFAASADLVRINPLAAFIDIMRVPLMGGKLDPVTVLIAAATTAVLLIAATIAFALMRGRLVFWV